MHALLIVVAVAAAAPQAQYFRLPSADLPRALMWRSSVRPMLGNAEATWCGHDRH